MIPASIQNHILLMGQLLSTSVNALISSGTDFQERHHPGFHEDMSTERPVVKLAAPSHDALLEFAVSAP